MLHKYFLTVKIKDFVHNKIYFVLETVGQLFVLAPILYLLAFV